MAYTQPSRLRQKDKNYLKVNWVSLGRVIIGYAVSIDMSLFVHVLDLGPIASELALMSKDAFWGMKHKRSYIKEIWIKTTLCCHTM